MSFMIMGEPLASPRKKVRMTHDYPCSMDGAEDSGYKESETHPAPAQANGTKDQLSNEATCGITEFVSPDLLGFKGILKKRYTDFLVNEILPSGQVLHLTDLKAPKRNPPEKEKYARFASSPSTKILETTDGASESIFQSHNTMQGTVNTDATVPASTTRTFSPAHSPLAATKPHTVKLEPVSPEASAFPTSTASDPLAHQFADPAPHQRNLAHNTNSRGSVPTSPVESQGKAVRTRQKVNIRHTSQGWLEVDNEKEPGVKDEDCKKRDTDVNGVNHAHRMTSGPKEDVPETVTAVYAPQASTQEQWQAYANVPEHFNISNEDKEILLSYFSPAVVDAVRSLYNRATNPSHRNAKDSGSVRSGVIDRQLRTKIHQDIRRIFDSRLETMTEHDGTMIISAMSQTPSYSGKSTPRYDGRGNNRTNGKGGRRNDDWNQGKSFRGKPGWQELGGEYLHFTLYKENKDTMEAISWLSKKLQTQPRSFQFAGTKDRRAVTVQRVSVYRTPIQKLISAGWTLRNAKIGDYVYQPHALQLGELNGNEFVITLRECNFHYPEEDGIKVTADAARSIVGEAIKNLSERGFINYYGLQRFGTFSISTDIVGVKMLQGDFRGAVDAILHYSPDSLAAAQASDSSTDKTSRDDAARASVIHSFQTGSKVASVIDDLPRRFSAESAIIRHLGRSNQINDNLGALKMVSRPLRLMYVHAYQSLVWNMAASERWKRYGSTVVDGDLILVDEHNSKADPEVKIEDTDQDGEAVVRPSAEDRANNEDDLFVRARALSKGEAESGKYSIFDVVLPTPGFDILYPSNDMLSFYRDFMASDRGGGLDPHDMRRNWKDISLSGSYRKFLAKPGNNVSYEVRTYDNDDEQFVETDAERLDISKGTKGSKYDDKLESSARNYETKGSNGFANAHHESGEPNDREMEGIATDKASPTDTDDHGGVRLDWNVHPKVDKKIAVILRLQLGTSQYATMALRELMKLGGAKQYKPDLGEDR